MAPGRRLGTALSALPVLLVLLLLAAGCGEKKVDLPAAPPATSSAPPPTASAPAFTMPADGAPIGAEVSARPPDRRSAQGAAAFAAWTLSLLLHTPREDSSTQLWNQAAGAACDACRKTAAVWTDQASKGQVFRYARTPTLVRTVVRAQEQGDGWFVEYEVAVPRSTLRQGDQVLQHIGPEHLDYTFRLAWQGDQWRLEDFHVLG